MSTACEVPTMPLRYKCDGEDLVYAANFSNRTEIVDDGEELSGTPSVSISPTGSLTAGTPVLGTGVNKNKVLVRLTGGLVGTHYVITFTAPTDNPPNKLQLKCPLLVQ